MFRRISTIALTTYRELIRSKILYSLFLFAFLVVGASALFGSVTIGDQLKVIKDFGLFAISIFSVGFAIVAGSSLLQKELSRKTIFTLLCRPVHRWEFLTGKFLGMYATVLVMITLMGFGLSGFILLFGEGASLSMFLAYYHIALELLIICAAVIFFSAIVVTPVLIGLFSFGLFLVGRSIDLLLTLASQQLAGSPTATLFEVLYWVLPQLSAITVSDPVVHGETIPLFRTVWATVYAIAYGIVLLLIAQQIFRRREFH